MGFKPLPTAHALIPRKKREKPLPDFSLNMASNRWVIQTILEECDTENDI